MLARTLFAALLLTLATACSSGGGGGPAPRVVPPGYKPSSCATDTVGPQAVLANAGRIARVDSGYFGKRYNSADLEAVLKASIESTAAYGAATGAEISAVSFGAADEADAQKEAEGSCYSYQFLPKASEKLMKVWAEAAQGGAEMGGQLQGLYTNFGGPKVLILRGSDRWTLVHELMHYNFDKTRTDERADTRGTILARINRAQKAFDKHMTDFKALPNRRDLQMAADDVDQMIRLVHQQNVDSFLEEVTIEAMLIDRYMDRMLTNVTRDSAKSAVWYIVKSKENAMTDFSDYNSLLDQVEKLANENLWPEIAETVQKDRDFMTAVNARVEEIVKIAEDRVKVLDPQTPTPGRSRTGEEITLGRRSSETPAMSAWITEFVNSPEYLANKRGARELVEKFGN